MSTAIIVTIAASFCGLIITALLIAGTLLVGNLQQKVYRYFWAPLKTIKPQSKR